MLVDESSLHKHNQITFFSLARQANLTWRANLQTAKMLETSSISLRERFSSAVFKSSRSLRDHSGDIILILAQSR